MKTNKFNLKSVWNRISSTQIGMQTSMLSYKYPYSIRIGKQSQESEGKSQKAGFKTQKSGFRAGLLRRVAAVVL